MRNKNKKGFTLIELLVVIFIMAIMAVVTIPRYASYRNKKAMSYARTQIITDLRYTQDYTLGTKKLLDGTSATGGFGVQFRKGSSYVIFGDGGGDPDHAYGGGNELFETVKLVGNVTISRLTVNGNDMDVVNYVSEPPYGKIYINNLDDDVTLVVTFTNNAGLSENITINNSGFIS